MSEWIKASEQLPPDESVVLAVKELRNGTRDVCLARCQRGYKFYDPETRRSWTGPYWTCGGNNNIIYWMPLPAMPEKGEDNE